MARVVSVLFVCFLLFSTLWAAPIPNARDLKKSQLRNLVNRALGQRLSVMKAPSVGLGGAITCDGTAQHRTVVSDAG